MTKGRRIRVTENMGSRYTNKVINDYLSSDGLMESLDSGIVPQFILTKLVLFISKQSFMHAYSIVKFRILFIKSMRTLKIQKQYCAQGMSRQKPKRQ